MTAETHTISKVPLDSMSWKSRKNLTRQCGISVRPANITQGVNSHSFELFGSLFDSTGQTVGGVEVPSDGSLMLFLLPEEQTGGILDLLMTCHRRPDLVSRVQIDIPYSVVAGDAEVTSVKLYATSADGDDITDKLTSKYDISQPGSTIPPEVQSGGDEDKLIATCDLNTPGVATGDITDFLKTVNYPALTLNITAVIEVEGTVATINTDALGVTFYLKGDLTLTSSREDFLGDRYAYFSVDHHALHMTVDFTTGEAQLSPDTDSHSYKSEANDLTKPASSERQEVLGIWSDGSSGPYLAKYTVDFKVRSKGTLSSEGPIEYISAEVDIEGNIVPLFVTADGRLNLIDPVLTDADGRYEDQGEEGDSVHTQPSVRVSSTGCEVIRVYAYEEGYDPSSSDIYHKLEYQDDEPQNRASALLKDSQGRPVFVAIVPKDISIDSTRVDISTLYISDDSEYIDQYGTEKRSVVM